MRISIVIFDEFTDIDLFLMWDLFNRVRLPDWEVRIVGDKSHHISTTGLTTATHGSIEEANQSDVVLFVSGLGTRSKMRDEVWLSRFKLNPEKQIGSFISSARITRKQNRNNVSDNKTRIGKIWDDSGGKAVY